MRELFVRKNVLIASMLLLLIAAFLAGGIALSSVSAASINNGSGKEKCEKQEPQCQGKQDNPAMTKAIVRVESVSGNHIQGTVLQSAGDLGGTVIIVTTASTEYKPDASSVVVGKTIFVVGIVNKDGSVTAQTLGAYDPTEADRSGVITTIHGSTLTIRSKDSTQVILLAANTMYARLQPGTKETTPATLSDLQVGDSIDVSGKLNSDGSLTALRIMLLPADAQLK